MRNPLRKKSFLSSEMHQQSTHSWIGLVFCPASDVPRITTTTSRTRSLQACSVHYRFLKGGQKRGPRRKLPKARRQQRWYERCGKDCSLRVGFAMQLTRLEYAVQQWWASVKFALGLTMIVVLRLYRIRLIRAELRRKLHVIVDGDNYCTPQRRFDNSFQDWCYHMARLRNFAPCRPR